MPGTPAEPHLLIVEDNDDEIALVQRALARAGVTWAIDVAHDPSQARERLDRSPAPGLVVLDIHLGDENGLELIPELRARPETRDVPVVVLTSDADPDVQREALARGASLFLRKPFSATAYDEIAGQITTLLGER